MKLLLQRICLPLKEFTLEVDVEIQGQVTAIFGPSGAGKTSLLDLVAGLRRPKCALIQLNDHVLTDTARGLKVPARSREIGYVTHDPSEAAALCDEVLVMEHGRFVRQGEPEGIFADFSTNLAADGPSRRWNG